MTTQQAANNPTSNLSKKLTAASKTMSDNDRAIAQWMATGLTREQAYQRALFG